MDVHGFVIRQYTDMKWKRSGGLCYDKRMNMIVYGSGYSNLQIVSTLGVKLKTIPTPKNPISVDYLREDDAIIVVLTQGIYWCWISRDCLRSKVVRRFDKQGRNKTRDQCP